MKRVLLATIAVGAGALFIALAVLTTLRAQARGPLAVSGADLLDMGSLAYLRAALVSTGGRVISVSNGGAIVQGRRGAVQQVFFRPDTAFKYRDAVVTAAAIEPGAHLSVQGLHGTRGFIAAKVLISPHRHAIGGLVAPGIGGLITVVNRRGAEQLVRLLPGAAITLNKRVLRGSLRTGMRVLTFAVPDPRVPGILLADSVRVLIAPTTVRVGGLIQRIDAVHDLISIYNKTQDRVYTIEVTQGTKVTLSKWDSGYADMLIGDHLTVSGKTDPTGPAPNPIAAKRIRISSPNFGGVITAIAPAPHGAAVLTVRARRNRLLRIDAPGRTPVIYGAQTAHVLDLQVGLKIAARGTRLGKFELQASALRVYPHQHTVGGMVASILPGLYRIVSSTDGSQIIIHVTPDTTYTLNGKTATAAAAKVGLHIRVFGYDALRSEQKGLPELIARRVSVTVHHHTAHKSTAHKKKAAQPLATATAQPTARSA